MINASERGPGTWKIAWALALGAALAFLPTLGYGFVCWDDEHNFSWNLDFGGLSWPRVRWAWITFRTGVYQPLAWMFLEAQASVWGLDPRGYHATSVLFHALDAALLYRLIVVLLRRCRPERDRREVLARHQAAGLAALLFAVHPLRVEVVAWASCQPYLPSVGFAMLATLAYLRSQPEAGPSSRGWLVTAWLLYTVAVLFKAEAATLPAWLLILDVYPLRRVGRGRWFRWGVWLEKVPFAAIGLACLGLAARARGVMDQGATAGPYDVPAHAAQAGYSVAFYLAKGAWPVDLSTFYGMPERIDWSAWPFGPATLAVVIGTVGAYLARRRWPGLLACWLAYLAALSLHLGFVPTGPVIAADRYSYLASLPLAVLLAGGLAGLLTREGWTRGVVVAGVLGLAVVLGGMSWVQCRQWSTSEILLRTALARGGSRSPELRSALALALLRQKRLPEAAALCEDALRLEPDYFQAHYNLGLILGEQGRYAEAERHFAKAETLDPDDRDAQFNLAVALARQGKTPAAIDHFQRALKILPLPEDAFSLAILLNESGRYPEAAGAYRLAARLRPDHAPTHNNLGAVLVALGDYPAAKAQFEEALRIDPNYSRARKGLNVVRQRLGQGP
jgi:tetratricopeptide (TPR) repeat protein